LAAGRQKEKHLFIYTTRKPVYTRRVVSCGLEQSNQRRITATSRPVLLKSSSVQSTVVRKTM